MTFRIALDLDGCVYHWDRTARYMLRRKLTGEGRLIPSALYDPSQEWNSIQEAVEPQDWTWLWNDGVKLGLFRYGHVIGGAIEGTTALSQMGEVIIVTARPKEAVRDTLAWVAFMLDKVRIAGIRFTEKKTDVEADVFIDDSPHNIMVLRQAGHRVVGYAQPWNSCMRKAKVGSSGLLDVGGVGEMMPSRLDPPRFYWAWDWPGVVTAVHLVLGVDS